MVVKRETYPPTHPFPTHSSSFEPPSFPLPSHLQANSSLIRVGGWVGGWVGGTYLQPSNLLEDDVVGGMVVKGHLHTRELRGQGGAVFVDLFFG